MVPKILEVNNQQFPAQKCLQRMVAVATKYLQQLPNFLEKPQTPGHNFTLGSFKSQL